MIQITSEMTKKAKASKNFGASLLPSGQLAKMIPQLLGVTVPRGQKKFLGHILMVVVSLEQ